MRPTLLDLFSGEGGCSVGYHRAGFEVTGVDNRPMPAYPHPDRFVQADALEYAAEHGHRFDAVAASPPCQRYSWSSAKHRNAGKEYPDLLGPTRAVLESLGKPWVIENVTGAPVDGGIVLCGKMFGLRVYRHRHFEASFLLMQPPHPKHTARCAGVGCVPKDGEYITVAGHYGRQATAAAAMGIGWMTRAGLSQAIPPAYTEYVGRQLLAVVSV